MTTLKAFHNDSAIKDKYLKRVRYHFEQDNIIRGTGWENGKGCAVGCTLENYDHSRYPIELGIPEWLARVEDTLFEGMSKEKSRTWPMDFLKAIHIGADLEKIKAPFLIMILKSTLETFDHNKFPEILSVIQDSINLWESDDIGSNEWLNRAARAAYAADAADAARAAYAAYAADAAADAARAARAARAAYAADAADAAAYAAARAADAAAYAAAADAAARAADAAAYAAAADAAARAKFDYFADELLTILRNCK